MTSGAVPPATIAAILSGQASLGTPLVDHLEVGIELGVPGDRLAADFELLGIAEDAEAHRAAALRPGAERRRQRAPPRGGAAPAGCAG